MRREVTSTKHKPGSRKDKANVSGQHWRVKWGKFERLPKNIGQKFIMEVIAGKYVLAKNVKLMK